MIRNIKLFSCFFLITYLISGCEFHRFYSVDLNKLNLKGSYTIYHAAMGSGIGVIFRVEVPNNPIRNITFDSLHFSNLALPCKLTKINGKKTIEANYLQIKQKQNQALNVIDVFEENTDNFILNKEFAPSHITGIYDGKKFKIKIIEFKEEN